MGIRKNVYFQDTKLAKKVDKYCKDHYQNFSYMACEALRMYLKVKELEEDAIRKSKITLSDI